MMLSQIIAFAAAAILETWSQEATRLSVKKGTAIVIPCRYDLKHAENEKYLCRCDFGSQCTEVVRTGQENHSDKYSISDDRQQQVFSVTIRDLTVDDQCFLCGVAQMKGPDLMHKVELRVGSGQPQLHVVRQSVTAALGGSETVECQYNRKDKFKWCKIGGGCVLKSGQLDGVMVSFNTVKKSTRVTMSELRQESAGWYFCQNNRFQMPVNVTVSSASTTTALRVTSAAHESTLETASVTFRSTVTENDLQGRKSGLSTDIVIAIFATLGLVVIFVGGGVATWKMKSRKSLLKESSAETEKEPDVVYADIIHNQQASNTKRDPPEESVMYSTVVTQDTSRQKTQPTEESVIYSKVCKQRM